MTMVPVSTVFIIGAGAGIDVDMPTGETLCNEIAGKLTKKLSGNDKTIDELRRISRERNIDFNELTAAGRRISKGIHFAGSIDSYIHTHKSDELIKVCGKLGIVQTIIEHEKRSKLFVNTTKRPFAFLDESGVRSSWLRQFTLLLQDGIIAGENLADIFKNVLIINFNYDRCIEQFLYWTLQGLFGIAGGRAAELIAKLKIYHPYGVVAPLPWQKSGGLEFGGDPQGDTSYGNLIDDIRTYNEEVQEGTDLQIMRQIFAVSMRFIWLGFHFHKQNLELIKPAAMRDGTLVELYATTLNRSAADLEVIRSRIGQMFGVNITYHRIEYADTDCRGLFTAFGAKFGAV
jgi:hypothetical protein